MEAPEHGDRLRFEYHAIRARGGVIDLADRCKLLFTGEDRVRFLNGQVSANIKAAPVPSVLPACVLNAKGKLCADVFVSLGPSGILVDADAAVADSLRARFERYIVADDVVVEDVTQRIAIMHTVGVPAEDLRALSGLVPIPVNRCGLPGFDLSPPLRIDLPPLWERFAAAIPVISPELFEILRIEAGVPRWGFELNENTLPAEAGLDRTHIDFHKGCYLGQEIVSRIESVGRVNHSLTAFTSADERLPALGAALHAKAGSDEPIGVITSAAWSFALERPLALGYLRRTAAPGEYLARPADTDAKAVMITLAACPFPITT